MSLINKPMLDLGQFTEPVLVFGGAYSNLQAALAMQAVAETRGIPASHVVCTGDVVAYCAQPEEAVAAIRAWGIHVVQGNCEESIGESLDDCGCGFEEGSTCSLLSDSWYRFTQANVSRESRQWMSQLPTLIRFCLQGRRFCCLHADATSNNRFVFESSSKQDKAAQCAQLDADVIIGGHCGLPFGQLLSGVTKSGANKTIEKAWLNAGVIGMPANDGTASTWYLILEPNGQVISASWHRLEYDYTATQNAMHFAGLPSAYRESLASGLWPSEDVLPQLEKAQRGKTLELPPLNL